MRHFRDRHLHGYLLSQLSLLALLPCRRSLVGVHVQFKDILFELKGHLPSSLRHFELLVQRLKFLCELAKQHFGLVN